MTSAVVFPGISPCPFAETGRFLLINPEARKLTAIADEVLGYSLIDRFRTAEGDFTEYERVAFLIVCLALAYWSGRDFQLCTGPSFGGTPAAVYSGALSFPDAVRMTARWTRLIDDYFAIRHGDVVTQSFARTPPELLAEILGELEAEGEWHDIACYVDHDFTMLSLREHRLDWLHRRLRAGGGLPLYTMRPPMHSRAFAPLREIIDGELFCELTFTDPLTPIVSDHDGSLLTTANQVRTLLLDGVTRPVRWPAAVTAMRERGVDTACVSGPDALWGRVACTRDAFEVVALTPALALKPRRRSPAKKLENRDALAEGTAP